MRAHKGLQAWLEEGAERPAFLSVLVGLVLRSAQFYSGGALSLPRLLGPAWLLVFDFVTGLGIALGAELLMASAGRTRRRYLAELRDTEGRRGLSKQERAAMCAQYRDQARANGIFSLIGGTATVIGGMSFVWQANGNHSLSTLASETVMMGIMVCVSYYFGVVKEHVPVDPAKVAQEDALNIRANLTQEAAKRIAAGQAAPQDVQLVAESLPRPERARFRAAFGTSTADDPTWSAQEIAQWLGKPDDLSLRRHIARRLRAAEDAGRDIRRNDRGAYELRRSLALALFAEDFLRASGSDTAATRARPQRALRLVPEPVARDTDATQTAVGQA